MTCKIIRRHLSKAIYSKACLFRFSLIPLPLQPYSPVFLQGRDIYSTSLPTLPSAPFAKHHLWLFQKEIREGDHFTDIRSSQSHGPLYGGFGRGSSTDQ